MPLASDMLATPRPPISFDIDQVANSINSLMLLNLLDRFSGLGEWVARTAATLSPERRHQNQVVLDGLHYAVVPDRRWRSFPAYIDGLVAQPPEALRDRLLQGLLHDRCTSPLDRPPTPPPQAETLLSSVDGYLNFLYDHFEADDIDEAIESEAHGLFNDPLRMREQIVSHLRAMWVEVLEPEWERVAPMLHESVRAFRQIDLTGLSPLVVAQQVTGQPLNAAKWELLFGEARQVIFVPSAHLGPYVRKLRSPNQLWLLFGARLPDGSNSQRSQLNRSELLAQLGALTDDTRLRILALVGQHDQLCAQDIITHLDLSQSAASRHLRQLSATGFLAERWRDGSKCYSLNRDRIGEVFRCLDVILDSGAIPADRTLSAAKDLGS